MGYDIYRLDTDFRQVERKLTLKDRQDLWRQNQFEHPDEDLGADGMLCYFRRNIFGGGRLAETLITHDLGYYHDLSGMDWTTVDEAAQKYDAEHGEDAWQELGRAEQFAIMPELQTMLSLTKPDTPGINVAKLCYSNDGWIITPPEYISMLGMFKDLPDDIQAVLISDDWDMNGGFGPDFFAFAQACAKSGGSETW